MSEIEISEVYNIINSYARSGADYMALATAYDILSCACIKKEKERTKEKEIEQRILSIISGRQNQERNIGDEVRRWFTGTVGEWNINQLFSELCLKTKREKDAAKQTVRRAVGKELEHVGQRSGIYRRIEQNFEEQAWWEEDEKQLYMRFPLDLHNLVKILPGSLILVEGVKSAGKTAFAFESCRLNKHLWPEKTRYLNIEMANAEIKERAEKYPPEEWSVKKIQEQVQFIKKYDSWSDLILPDGFTVVDYVRDTLEAYKIAFHIEKIHAKLNRGVALVIVQRDAKKDYGQGGANIRSIPRLIVSLIKDQNNDRFMKIEDTKHFWKPPNPSGMQIQYNLIDGHKWRPAKIGDTLSEWHHETESKYQRFAKG